MILLHRKRSILDLLQYTNRNLQDSMIVILYHAKFTDRWRKILEQKIDNRERYSKIETDGKRR